MGWAVLGAPALRGLAALGPVSHIAPEKHLNTADGLLQRSLWTSQALLPSPSLLVWECQPGHHPGQVSSLVIHLRNLPQTPQRASSSGLWAGARKHIRLWLLMLSNISKVPSLLRAQDRTRLCLLQPHEGDPAAGLPCLLPCPQRPVFFAHVSLTRHLQHARPHARPVNTIVKGSRGSPPSKFMVNH